MPYLVRMCLFRAPDATLSKMGVFLGVNVWLPSQWVDGRMPNGRRLSPSGRRVCDLPVAMGGRTDAEWKRIASTRVSLVMGVAMGGRTDAEWKGSSNRVQAGGGVSSQWVDGRMPNGRCVPSDGTTPTPMSQWVDGRMPNGSKR